MPDRAAILGATGATRTTLPSQRRRLIAGRLLQRGSVSVAELEAGFAISPMTARRDIDELERHGVARRTHGGAVLPGPSSHEDSFLQRMESQPTPSSASPRPRSLLAPGEAVFVDSSTTAYWAARRIVRENVRCTLLTNSAPVMQLACEADAPQVDLIGIGGTLRKLTRSFVGPQAVAGIEAHYADQVLFSVRGLTQDGHLTEAVRRLAQAGLDVRTV